MSRCLYARPIRLHWTPSACCPALFEELFDSSDVDLLDAEQVGRVPSEAVYTGEDWFHHIWSRDLRERIPWPDYLLAVKEFLSSLTPNQEVHEAVFEFEALHNLDQAVGLHIRQTDNVADYEALKRNPTFNIENTSRVEGFRELIERNPEQTYFLATDSRAVQRELTRAYGLRIRRWPTRFSLWMRILNKLQPSVGHRTSSMQDALAELLLLGRCRRIVGTYYSSFGEFAAVWASKDYSTMLGAAPVPFLALNKMISELRAME